ncbi:hypothetical protein GDO81_002730 [Engystomops pustulosus]|uniref:Spliceosome-associated protein CWC27 homolog n=1 Tax=Engystomops pustulosus TaxID=76066 RepID=A0AAV7DMK4_ENGPU|nr:hypothetical protein GDO81_002730 [Engystomops pustulosus]
MSNIYIQEPPTNGKVLLKTTAGEIDIELWSKEAPKACRNFIQLCLEGYYDNTIFHRVVPEFIIQGGDPTGTGTGGDSIYGKPFRILFNPFDDIVPRVTKKLKKDKQDEESKQPKVKGTKNFNLLSFGEEAEEEEEEVNKVSETFKGKSKSSHDLLKDDPRLSSVPAIESSKSSARSDSDGDEEESDEDDEGDLDSDEKQQMRDRISSKLKMDLNKSTKSSAIPSDSLQEKKSSRSEELRKEARQLKRELIAAKRKREDEAKEEEKEKEAKQAEQTVANSVLEEYMKEKEKYNNCRKKNTKKGTSREEQTLSLLNSFKSKLSQAIIEAPEEDPVSEMEEDDDKGWLSHMLQFDEKSQKVKDANVQDEDTFEIYDPRNPVNKRRREESKKLMKQKKERR